MPKKILIVDDQPENLETIANIFSSENAEFDVIKAPNGKVAMRILNKTIPDIIITDWEMPEMNGIELTKKIRQDQRTADIPVIMCTGVMTTSKNLSTALNAGASDYIRKPVDNIELIARTKANLHLAEQYYEVKKLNEIKNQIFAVISHDLRGPVGNIKSFADLVVQNKTSFSHSEILEFFEIIKKVSTTTFSTLENLLMWANSQRNAVNIDIKKQNINLAISNNLTLLDEVAKQKEIELINRTPEDLMAYFDLNMISTVVRNLISNAIKFTNNGGKVIVDAIASEKDLTISVKDNGVGISADRIDRIFDNKSFETTHGTSNEKGSGVGLKLCKDFVDRNNGEIWVESKNGEGTSFKFTLSVTKPQLQK